MALHASCGDPPLSHSLAPSLFAYSIVAYSWDALVLAVLYSSSLSSSKMGPAVGTSTQISKADAAGGLDTRMLTIGIFVFFFVPLMWHYVGHSATMIVSPFIGLFLFLFFREKEHGKKD